QSCSLAVVVRAPSVPGEALFGDLTELPEHCVLLRGLMGNPVQRFRIADFSGADSAATIIRFSPNAARTGEEMYFHRQELQHKATPDKPDAVYARKLQEVLGGQYGEITVAMQYQFQAWNMHIPGKYRDLVFGIGAEELGHVEMLAIMIAQLLEKAPLWITEEAVQDDPTVAAIVGGTDVQHAIVAGAGARPVDSNGNPWQGSYITASGNLLADFQANANAEMQGRVQVARLYHMTDDHGVRDLLAFL